MFLASDKVDIHELIEKQCERIATTRGFSVVEVQVTGAGRRSLVRVFIDKPGGVTINDCTGFSRELDVLLNADNLLDGPYTLEVSSPGLNRPLKTPEDFKRNIGRRLQISTARDLMPQNQEGILHDVKNGGIVLQRESQSVEIQIADIVRAKVEVQFK